MKTLFHHIKARLRSLRGASTVTRLAAFLAFAAFLLTSPAARASIAYGSINNFDTVNDTGSQCHGFEIELEDVHSSDVTYTYDWNHYGTPTITEDNSVAGHPRTFIRWASKKNPDGTWAAFTAVPAGPIAPTDGHMFTDPSVNFGGEHFGVGFTIQPTAIKYNWLLDDGSGNLMKGPPVQVATPTFVYFPPAGNAPAQVQAAIVPPPPQAPDPREFGDAIWVKEIRTTTHNSNEVKLRDLVSDDPDDPNDKNWRNGEPDEVETEWQILQTDYKKADGGNNGELQGAPEDLDGGDEVVTRRYEFFKYVGPLDPETGEALAENVGPDGIHGEGFKEIDGVMTDLSTIVIVGDYTGAQMAAVDVGAEVGIIDHLQDGELDVEYPSRKVVIGGNSPFVATTSGALPEGMSFDPVTGIVSGTPIQPGTFSFTVNASDAVAPVKTKTFTFNVLAAGPVIPQAQVDTVAAPAGSGTTLGDGVYEVGLNATVEAFPAPGFVFANWTDNGVIVSTSASYTFVVDVNHSLTANFIPAVGNVIATSANPPAGGNTAGGGTFATGNNVTVTATANPGYAFTGWTEGGVPVSGNASYTFAISANRSLVANFSVSVADVPTNVAPAAGAASQLLSPVLQASAFTAGPGLTHAASQWIVRRVSDHSIAFDSGTDAAHLTTLTVPVALAAGVAYEWQVQYQDNLGNWSGYSAPTAFTTQQPAVVSFTVFKGAYTGLVESGENALRGSITVSLSSSGSVSSTVKLGRASYRLTGKMGTDGSLSTSILRAGLPALNVTLSLDTTGSDQIRGTLSDGVETASLLLNRQVYSKTVPAPEGLVGSYTVLLPPDPAQTGPDAPQGHGYGTLTVKATGAVSFRGVLCDGTAVSRSTQVSKTGTVPFFAAPFRDGGAAVGWLTFRDRPSVSDIDGTIAWHKDAVAGPVANTRYPAGFAVESAAVGSRYAVPAAGIRALALLDKVGNAAVEFSGNNLSAAMAPQTITLDASNVITGIPAGKFSMKLNVKTGLFTGKFLPPGDTRTVSFSGALFQKQDAAGFGDAGGLFVNLLQTGSVLLSPVP